MKRAVIFDLDGTLWDAVGPLTDYWNEVRQQELSGRRRITAAQMQSWTGQGVRELARSILPERPLDTWFDAYLQYLHGENDYLLHHPPTLYPQPVSYTHLVPGAAHRRRRPSPGAHCRDEDR